MTAGLTASASVLSMARVCTLVSPSCLVQPVIHTSVNPTHEGSPVDFVGFALGVLLGVPIYSALSYLALRRWEASRG